MVLHGLPLLLALLLLLPAVASPSGNAHHLLPPEPAAVALQLRVNSSVASGHPSLAVAAAEYFFNSQPLVIVGGRNLELDGTGSVLWFSVGAGLVLHRCVNVTVVGFALDYDPPAFFQATALAPAQAVAGGVTVRMQSDPGFGSLAQFELAYGSADPANEFTQGPQWWSPAGKIVYNGWQDKVSASATAPDGSFNFTQQGSIKSNALSPGDKVTLIIRQGFTLLLHNSSRCSVQDVTLFSASFMAICEFDGRGAHHYSGVRVVRRNVSDPTELCATTRQTDAQKELRKGRLGREQQTGTRTQLTKKRKCETRTYSHSHSLSTTSGRRLNCQRTGTSRTVNRDKGIT